MEDRTFTFEAGMEELETLVRALERGDMQLSESFAAFERARALEKKLRTILDEGDTRIRTLTEKGEDIFEGDGELP